MNDIYATSSPLPYAQSASTGASALPSRRERLHALVTLKTQRRYLVLAAIALLILSAALLIATIRAEATPEVVPLGKGVAGVDSEIVVDENMVERAPVAEAVAPEPVAPAGEQEIAGGEASYYGDRFAGRRTASGETFNPGDLTAAHRTLPMGSKVRVTNTRNGESIVVRINDRGPFHRNRVIDLSKAAAQRIGMLNAGRAPVRLALLVQ